MEFAARDRLGGKLFAWGDAFELHGKPMANTWQGTRSTTPASVSGQRAQCVIRIGGSAATWPLLPSLAGKVIYYEYLIHYEYLERRDPIL
jgi:hypothetical protein